MNPRVRENLATVLRNKAILSAVVAVLYGASPIDVLPDVIPILGLLDDAVVVPAFFLMAYLQLRRSRRVAAGKDPAGLPTR